MLILKVLKIISGVVLTMLLWHIGLWKSDEFPSIFQQVGLSKKIYLEVMFPNKEIIAIGAGIVVCLIQLLGLKNPFKEKEKKILNDLQRHYINENFKGEDEHNRITIFKKKRGCMIYWMYFKKCFIENFTPHYKNGLIRFYIRKFPLPHRSYLVQYTRNGFPNPKGSSTFFLVAKRETEISSLAAEALYKGRSMNVDLPLINKDEVLRIADLNSSKVRCKKTVVEYMENGKINSFEMLKSFHRYPTKIYADPISIGDNKFWGCVVFDSDDGAFDSNSSYQFFVSYSKVVQCVISNLNK